MDRSVLLRPVVVGANHRSSSVALRDSLFVDDNAQAAFLSDLRDAGVAQAIVLSTCDRVEVQAMHPDAAHVEKVVTSALARRAGLPEKNLSRHLYTLTDAAAIRHCFAVASSLDSLVVGEPQVAGQVKNSQKLAQQAGLCGPELDALLAAVFAAAKRVRAETAISERPVSIASAAVQCARDLHGDIAGCDALLVGVGDMGELVAQRLGEAGLRRLVVMAPRAGAAEALAERLGCHVAAFDELAARLVDADILVTAVGDRQYILSPDLIQSALRRRRQKPIFLVDTGIPGDIDIAVNRLDGAYLYDLSDLERIAMEGRTTREAAARSAWAIIDAELAAFGRNKAARAAVPAIVSLRGHFEAVRAQVLDEAGNDADKATRLLIHRLLHDPSEVFKELAADGHGPAPDWQAADGVLRRLFRLDAQAGQD